MSTANNLIVKVNADKGNTVLFRTKKTGGALEISLDGDIWHSIGITELDSVDIGYSFAAPLHKTSNSNEVYLSCAVSDNIDVNDPLKTVVVGSSGVIGYNLLPRVVYDLRNAVVDGVISVDSLPANLVYTGADGLIPKELISVDEWEDLTV